MVKIPTLKEEWFLPRVDVSFFTKIDDGTWKVKDLITNDIFYVINEILKRICPTDRSQFLSSCGFEVVAYSGRWLVKDGQGNFYKFGVLQDESADVEEEILGRIKAKCPEMLIYFPQIEKINSAVMRCEYVEGKSIEFIQRIDKHLAEKYMSKVHSLLRLLSNFGINIEDVDSNGTNVLVNNKGEIKIIDFCGFW